MQIKDNSRRRRLLRLPAQFGQGDFAALLVRFAPFHLQLSPESTPLT